MKNRPEQEKASKVPEGFWTKCSQCSEVLQTKLLRENLEVCTTCGFHFRIRSDLRLEWILDPGTFFELGETLRSNDPLGFQEPPGKQGTKPSYIEKIEKAEKQSGLSEAVKVGLGKLKGRPIAVGVFDFGFMGGSMGVVVGERLALLFETALDQKTPVLVVTSSGGARMQEGALSLMQMAKLNAFLPKFQKASVPYLTLLTDPTTGGVAASFATVADIVLAEPKALIGFAGPRVIQQTIRQALPEGFQRSEYLLEHGFVDRIVERKHLRDEIHFWISHLSGHREAK